MILGVDLKLQLQRVAKNLISIPVRRKASRFTLLVFSCRSGRVDKGCRLLRLPVELLLHILEYLQSTTPVQHSDYPYPLIAFRL